MSNGGNLSLPSLGNLELLVSYASWQMLLIWLALIYNHKQTGTNLALIVPYHYELMKQIIVSGEAEWNW